MFVPNAVIVYDAGSVVRWSNPSNLPHNVVGVFNQTIASNAANTTGIIPENSTENSNNTNAETSAVAIDSGFIQPNQSWQYRFDKEGIFNYLCTIHSEEGMRGILIIKPSSTP
jgi:plastocyanin